jgi:dipeptidyl-peptidase-4
MNIRTLAAAHFLSLTSLCAHAQITLEDIWKNGRFTAEVVRGLESLPDGEHYSAVEADGDAQQIVKYSYRTGERTGTLISAKELSGTAVEEYSFTPDMAFAMIGTEERPLYRHSSAYQYMLFDMKARSLRKVADGHVFLADLAPSADRVAFVRDNNLWVEDLRSGKVSAITTKGKKNEFIYGMADWVYEEEFSFTKAFHWSPDGKKLAYYGFDERKVPEFGMDTYKGELYPQNERFKYPKAGEANALVSIFIHDLATGTTTELALTMDGGDFYIPRIKWTNDPNTLCVQRMNRLQNKLELILADAATGRLRTVLTEEAATYIDITDDLTFLPDGRHFIHSSEKSGYNHLYLFDMDGKEVRQLTRGDWDVTAFYGADADGRNIFYQAADEMPMQRNLYRAAVDGSGSSSISSGKGWHNAEFSTGMRFYINTYSDANTPPLVTLHDAAGKQIRVLKDNARLKGTIAEVKLPKKEFFRFDTRAVERMRGWMIKPNDFDPNKKYPVLLCIYGGPGSQTVMDEWGGTGLMWHGMLAQMGYIVVSVDNRGTGARGRDWKHCTYQQLGQLETLDMMATARHLATLPYVDAGRIGIQGWSFGGYMSSLCITKGADLFKTAIAVAPVTNWRYYDSIYTERFLRRPQENAKGYDDNSPINFVDRLKGNYLLVHGMADDNVHVQNTMEMTEALVKANKQYEQFIYPDRNHGIYGGNTRLHLYTMMTDFIKRKL